MQHRSRPHRGSGRHAGENRSDKGRDYQTRLRRCHLPGAAPSVEAVFEERCKKVGATLHKADFDSIRLESHGLSGQVFSCGRFEHLKLPLLGEHQLHNAAVVLAAVDALKAKGWNLTDEAVRTGLETVQWPGRFQLMREKPLFIVDGGHNPQCIEALVQNIDDYLKGRELTILIRRSGR